MTQQNQSFCAQLSEPFKFIQKFALTELYFYQPPEMLAINLSANWSLIIMNVNGEFGGLCGLLKLCFHIT